MSDLNAATNKKRKIIHRFYPIQVHKHHIFNGANTSSFRHESIENWKSYLVREHIQIYIAPSNFHAECFSLFFFNQVFLRDVLHLFIGNSFVKLNLEKQKNRRNCSISNYIIDIRIGLVKSRANQTPQVFPLHVKRSNPFRMMENRKYTI